MNYKNKSSKVSLWNSQPQINYSSTFKFLLFIKTSTMFNCSIALTPNPNPLKLQYFFGTLLWTYLILHLWFHQCEKTQKYSHKHTIFCIRSVHENQNHQNLEENAKPILNIVDAPNFKVALFFKWKNKIHFHFMKIFITSIFWSRICKYMVS